MITKQDLITLAEEEYPGVPFDSLSVFIRNDTGKIFFLKWHFSEFPPPNNLARLIEEGKNTIELEDLVSK